MQPPNREKPHRVLSLEAGDSSSFDAVVESSRVPKRAARWLRFLLL